MYAGFWKRLGAYVIDFIIIYFGGTVAVLGFMLVLSPLFLGMIGLIVASLETLGSTESDMIGVFMMVILILLSSVANVASVWLYYVLMESSKVQGTVGKMALGIVVVDAEMKPVSFGQASARFWSQFVSLLTLGIGYIMAGFTTRKQALHDLIAHTYVVNKNVLAYAKQLEASSPMEASPGGSEHLD